MQWLLNLLELMYVTIGVRADYARSCAVYMPLSYSVVLELFNDIVLYCGICLLMYSHIQKYFRYLQVDVAIDAQTVSFLASNLLNSLFQLLGRFELESILVECIYSLHCSPLEFCCALFS